MPHLNAVLFRIERMCQKTMENVNHAGLSEANWLVRLPLIWYNGVCSNVYSIPREQSICILAATKDDL